MSARNYLKNHSSVESLAPNYEYNQTLRTRSLIRLNGSNNFTAQLKARTISLAIIFYIIISINQSYMTNMIGGNLHRFRSNSEIDHDIRRNNVDGSAIKSAASMEKSIFTLAAASIAPPSAGGNARSTAHRVPPMNGSIFGKRSVGGSVKRTRPQPRMSGVSGPLGEPTSVSDRDGGADHYSNMITEIIDSFLAKNDQSK